MSRTAAALPDSSSSEPHRPTRATFADLRQEIGATRWLWPGWLPLGYVSLLAGSSKAGKSYVALNLAAVVCKPGLSWPDGSSGPEEPGCALWCESEGRMGVNLMRAAEIGIPDEKIILPLPRPNHLKPFRLDSEKHLAHLESAIAEYRPLLVVLDALAPSHGLKENDSSLGRLLARFSELMQKYGCAGLILHHIRKGVAGDGPREIGMDDLRGTSAIAAAVVTILGIDEPDPSSSRKRLVYISGNLGQDPEPVGLEWEQDDGDKVRLRFSAEVPEAGRQAGRMAQCRAALSDHLRGKGWIESGQVRRDLEKRGFKWRTVREEARRMEDARQMEKQRQPPVKGGPPLMMWKLSDPTPRDTGTGVPSAMTSMSGVSSVSPEEDE